MFLYCTTDKVGGWSGGSKVTYNESRALSDLGECQSWQCHCWDRSTFLNQQPSFDWFVQNDPWGWDIMASETLVSPADKYRLAHFYSGTFPKTIAQLKGAGTLLTYTVAAHSITASKQEHEKLGLSFPYPHLTDPALWDRYIAGYKAADVIICPSAIAAENLKTLGIDNHIRIIPY